MLAGIEAALSWGSEEQMKAVRALVRDCIDYAGLFPPAKLELETTVRNYAEYRWGADCWALGRLVLPATRLGEFVQRWPEFAAEWPVTVVLGPDYGAEISIALTSGAQVQMIECRPARAEHVAEIRRRVPDNVKVFVEAPAACDLEAVLAAIESAGACAKIRTGGVSTDAIPTVSDIAAFLTGCARRRICLKATAGLHHVFRGEHRLTYEVDSPEASMHGFGNVLIAALVAFGGGNPADVQEALEDDSPAHFNPCDRGIQWDGLSFSMEMIEELRSCFVVGFGSCSFEEPMSDLRAIGWLE